MRKKLAAVGLLVLWAGMAVATPIQTVRVGDHSISLLSANVEQSGKFVWTYRVTSGDSPAISHWVLGLCLENFVKTNEYKVSKVDGDPHFGLTGLKFDKGYDDDQSRLVKIYLDSAAEMETVSFGLKAGRDVYTGTIFAPGCSPGGEVPEPSTLILLSAGILGLTAKRKKLI